MDLQYLIFQSFFITIASTAFAMMVHIRGWNVLLAGLGGGLGIFIYDILLFFISSDLIAYTIAGFVISAYAEIMARVRKSPVTVFLIIAFIPLVPGGSAYNTMKYLVLGQTKLAGSTGLHTLAIAGCIALGVFLASSVLRLFPWMNNKHLFSFHKSHHNSQLS